jgi:ech hydrogenase subunit A
MLIVFHALAKSLLFLCVGTTEHNIGSRDIEDLDGIFTRLPKVASFMIIGIAGMFIAPFGMLISKYAAMKAFIESGNILLVMFIVFGSAATLFFWTKWLGKIVAVKASQENIEGKIHMEENFVLGTLAALTVAICLLFPVLSAFLIVPYLSSIYSDVGSMALSSGNMYLMVALLGSVILLVIGFFGKSNKRIVPIYMAGANAGDDLSYNGSMGKTVSVSLKNWYMQSYFGEKKMNYIGNISAVVMIVGVFALLLGGVL